MDYFDHLYEQAESIYDDMENKRSVHKEGVLRVLGMMFENLYEAYTQLRSERRDWFKVSDYPQFTERFLKSVRDKMGSEIKKYANYHPPFVSPFVKPSEEEERKMKDYADLKEQFGLTVSYHILKSSDIYVSKITKMLMLYETTLDCCELIDVSPSTLGDLEDPIISVTLRVEKIIDYIYKEIKVLNKDIGSALWKHVVEVLENEPELS